MTTPGLGAGDIVDSIKFGYKAVSALREGDHGARSHYQKTRTGLAQRVRALEEASSNAKHHANRSDHDAYLCLLEEDKALQLRLSRYEKHLGRGAKKGIHHGVFSKLRFALDEDQEIREQLDRTRPMLDAALINEVQCVDPISKTEIY
jgi:hypothetical protein